MTPHPSTLEDEAFAHALAAERRHNARRLAWLRFLGVSGFFAWTMLASLDDRSGVVARHGASSRSIGSSRSACSG